ncbi:hypothetical protein HK414_02675 [Ramlibacter terrae]|uniref:RHS repeat protein n=1 Tax=Ramlibacter terrae TaxID=2732511 RepID=A0ABX6P066_9BURK|nr:hypothetical protein HK414_02675 [Ramlibacter terrae]
MAKGWSRSDYGSKPEASADDRRTEYVYDRLNRKTEETRVAVEFGATTDGKSGTGDLTTSYAYDAVGNQTAVKDAAGGVTYTYYDALGRIQAVAAPKRDNAAGDVIKPLTTFRRDAHGKVVVTTEYAAGAQSASLAGYETDTHRDDRKTFASYDTLGRNVVTTDAAGHSQYLSYDRHGNWPSSGRRSWATARPEPSSGERVRQAGAAPANGHALFALDLQRRQRQGRGAGGCRPGQDDHDVQQLRRDDQQGAGLGRAGAVRLRRPAASGARTPETASGA